MSHGIPSDEVAKDYRMALEDLTMNSRYEISNLTVIAKENTEHAMAISEALRTHIKTVAPMKKLNAFYVLDSVVKNVGTPYTLFFGRNLYSTFMEAYALVDNNVRRKMEEMLKTWKEPVPGSLETRPVFPVEVTRPIENALLKAKTSAMQAQNEYARRQQQQPIIQRPGMSQTQAPYRDTPTPPNTQRQQYPPPGYPQAYGSQAVQAPQQYNGTPTYSQGQYNQSSPPQVQQYQPPSSQPYQSLAQQYQPPPAQQYQTSQVQQYQPPPSATQYAPPQSSTPVWQQQVQPQGVGAMDDSLEILKRDVANLITRLRAEFQMQPDPSVQAKISALLQLQTILQTQVLPQDQLAQVRNQVTALSAVKSQPLPTPVPVPAPVVVSQPPQQRTLAEILGTSKAAGLAALLAKTSAASQTPTPPPPQHVQAIRSPQLPYSNHHIPPVSSTQPVAAIDTMALFAKLKAQGLLGGPAKSTPPPQNLPPGTVPPPLPFPNSANGQGLRQPLSVISNDVQLKPQSLKIPRPHLISQLYEQLGKPCTQCGRRFKDDFEGKTKKAAHMDWHFKVNSRLANPDRQQVPQRSWFVDEMDWIKSRESADDHLASAIDNAPETSQAAAAKEPKRQWIAVPDDPELAKSICPIDHEGFKPVWLEEEQEFVWLDAIKVGGKIYHASCYEDAEKDKKDGLRGTPEPVLGKRKNEDDHMPMRIKKEPGV